MKNSFRWMLLCLSAFICSQSTRAAITVIDYYRLGDADPASANGATVNATSQDSIGTKHLTRIGSPTYTNSVSTSASVRNNSQLAMRFSGSAQGLSNSVLTTVVDNFGVEAWARPATATGNHSIAYNGNTSANGWGIYQFAGNYGALLGGLTTFGSASIALDGWTHVALVRAGGTNTLYINGAPAGSVLNTPAIPTGGFCIGMPGQGAATENFNGQIDEVRLFTFSPGQFSTNDLLLNAPIPASTVTMNDTLQTDVNGNGRPNPGDGLRYTVVITNTTGGTLSNAVFNSSAVPNAAQVSGSLKSTPLARADAPATNSAPGNPWHGTLNTTLNVTAGSGLLANDFLGVPSAQIASFGGGSFGGSVTANAAGLTAVNPAIGQLTVNADGSLTFSPAVNFNGLITFQYRLTNAAGFSDATAQLAIGARPSATNETYLVTGNTMLDTTLIPQSVLANDAGSLIGVSGNTAPANGTLILSGNGNFLFTPNAAFVGGNSFNYTITNGFGSATATVTLTVAARLWYIDGASIAGSADGRSTTPFKTILAFNTANDGAAGHPADNDNILIRDGTYTDGITLRVGQRLIGDGSSGGVTNALAMTLAPGSAEAPGVAISAFSGTDPIITSAAGNGVTLNANNSIRGITVGNTPAGIGYTGGAVGTLNISESSKTGTGGAISITTSGGLSVSFDTLDSANALGAAINLVSCGGTLNAAAGTISAPTGAGILINGSAGAITYPGNITKNNAGRIVDIQSRSSGTITLNGNLAQNNASSLGINVANCSGGTVIFSGSGKALNTAANTAVTVVNNPGTTINFTNGGLVLTTTSGLGINAAGGAAALNVTGSGNTISSSTGTALSIANTTIGASGLNFQSISANGAANGIILNGTGSGGLVVTGSGGANSGGTIQNCTGDGISLNTAQNVSLTSMGINNNNGNGIYGNQLSNFVLANCTVNNNDFDNVGTAESGLRFDNLLGTCMITNSTVSGTKGDNIRMTPTSGTLNHLLIIKSVIGPNPVGTGGNGLALVTSGTANATVTVNNSLFAGNQASGFLTTIAAGVSTITITNSLFQTNNINVDLGSSGTASQNINVVSNILLFAISNDINIVGDGQINGTIAKNLIGNGLADSGSRDSYDIAVSHRSNLAWRLAITNNVCRNSDFEGIFVRSGDVTGNSGSLALTLTGNTVFPPDDNSGFASSPRGIYVRSRQGTMLCCNIANNESQGNGGVGFHVHRSDTSVFTMQGFSVNGAATITANGNKTGGASPTTDTIGEPFQGACTTLLP